MERIRGIHHVPSGLMHVKVVESQEYGRQHCCVAEQSAPSVLGSVHTGPVDEVVEVVETEGVVVVDRGARIRAADDVKLAKMSNAEVHGQTVIVDSTVTVTMAVALRANSPVARMTAENCILTEVYVLRYYVRTVDFCS